MGISLFEESMLGIAKELLDGGKIILPQKVVTSLTFEGSEVVKKNINEVQKDEMHYEAFSLSGHGRIIG